MPDYTAGKARILLEPSARGFFTKAKAQLRTEAGQQKLQQDVLLKPTTTRFRTDADAQLRSMRGINYNVNLRPQISNRALFRADAKAQAETHLKGLYATMTVRGMVDMTYANNQMRAWRVKEEAKPLRIKVITEQVGGVGRPRAGSRINRETPILQPSETSAFGHTVPILKPKVDDTEAKRGVERLKRDIERPDRQPKVSPKVDKNEFEKAWDEVMRSFRPRRLPGPSIRGVELLAPAMLSIASESAPALVAALGAVVGAIEEMSGAALAAPGALAVLGTSIGTLALGVTGMKDAWKALSQESDRSGNQATADADKFARSQEQMRHAIVEQQKAQEDLTKARKDTRRELEDLHAEERSSYLSVAEAALDLQKARNELAQPSQGPLDYDQKIVREARAREALSEAIRKQGRTREDTTEADKKGVEQSDRVTQAQEALVRSNEQVADSLKAIQEGSSGAASAQDKVKAAMADLSPNAAELTQTLFDLRETALKPLARVVSQNMFAGMSNNIKSLVAADLPTLTQGFGRVASAINRNLLQIGSSLQTDQTRGVLDKIFGNTEEFHKRLTAAIDPAIRALGTLAAAGSDTMPRLATQFGNLTDRFAAWIEKANNEGRLDLWINHGITALETFGRSLGNIFRTLDSIGQAFGGGLTGSIENATKKMAAFFASPRGQNDMLSIIHLVKREFEDWKPILQDMPTIFLAMATGIRTSMGGLLPIFNVITSALKAFPELATVGAQAFVSWRALSPIMAVLSSGVNGVAGALERLPGVSRSSMSYIAREAEAMAGSTTTATQRAVNILTSIPGTINTSFERVRAATREGAAKAATSIGSELEKAVGFVGGAWGTRMVGAAGSSMGKLGGTIKTLGTSAVGGLQTALSSAATFMSGPWGLAVGAAVLALAPLIQANDDAAKSADAHQQAQQRLADTLDDVTAAAGEATRSHLSTELENYQPKEGLTGNVRAAAESQGIDRDRLLRSLLPGGQGQAVDIYQQLRKTARQPIIDAAGKGVLETLSEFGFSADNLVDAYLGDRDQVHRLQDIMNKPKYKLDAVLAGVTGFSLNDITKRLPQNVQQAALPAQYLSQAVPALTGAQQNALQAQRTAAGGVPTLKDAGARIFGAGAQVHYAGGVTKVEVPGNFEVDQKEQADNMKARNDSFHYDPYRNVTTVTLGIDDQNALVNIPRPPSRQTGGPSPTLGMPGPTGGIISELHPGEWVLPKHARSRIGDDWLREQTRNKAIIMPAGGGLDRNVDPGGDPWPTGAHGDMVRATPNRDDIPNAAATGHGDFFPHLNYSFDEGGPVPLPPNLPFPTPWTNSGDSFKGDSMIAPMDQPDNPNRDVIIPPVVPDLLAPERGRAQLPAPTTRDGPRGQYPLYDPNVTRNSYDLGTWGGIAGNEDIGHPPYSFEIGGPAPLSPFIPLPPEAPGPTSPAPGPPPPVPPPPKPSAPPTGSEGQPSTYDFGPKDVGPAPSGPGKPPGPAGGGGLKTAIPASGPGSTDPNAPVNISRTPDNATPAERDALNAPGPTVNPDGTISSPQAKLPSFGSALTNAFLGPWGFKQDPASGGIVSANAGQAGGNMDPGAYLGKWGGDFIVSLGETLLNGIGSFFGLNIDNPYFQAFKQTVGFYSGKLGQQADQYVDPNIQSIVGGGVGGYQQLVDPTTGDTYLIPSGANAGAGDPTAPLGDVSGLPPGKAPEGGLQPNAVKTERAISAAFPEIQQIGGVRADPLKWHPNGLALDIMIPGGDTHNGKNPQGKALGDRIWAWLGTHASELGVDMGSSLWQTDSGGNHYTHIHAAVYGKGNPAPAGSGGGGAAAAATPAAPAGTGDGGAGDPNDPDDNRPGGGGGGGGPAAAPGAAGGPPPLRIPGGGGGGPAAGKWAPGNGAPQGWRLAQGGIASAKWLLPDDAPDVQAGGSVPPGWHWNYVGLPPGFTAALYKDGSPPPTWPGTAAAPGTPNAGRSPFPFADPARGGGLAGPTAGNSGDLFGGGGGGYRRTFAGYRGHSRVYVLSAVGGRSRGGLGSSLGAAAAPVGEPGHDKASVARYIFDAAKSRGYNDHDALSIVAYAQGESSLNPGISGGQQGAGGSAGGAADEVIGLFQEKAGFAQAGGIDPAARSTVSGNVTAYLNQLVRHRGAGDIYDQLLATSVGGPMYTGGRGAMSGLEEQVRSLLGMQTATAQHMNGGYHYQYGGLLPQGVTIARHDQPQPDVVIPHAEAAAAVKALKAVPPPDYNVDQRAGKLAPQPPPEINIPKALPPAGPQAAPPPEPPSAPEPPPPPQILPGPAPGAAVAQTTAPDVSKSYEHPGLEKAVTSTASTAGNIASMVAGAMGGGMGGPLIAGLFQQGGKIANEAINVGSAFASGFLHFGGTTENPYGVMERRKDSPPALGADNRRVHMGNNYFASMDEWRRQNQLQDAQDMQAGMARIR